VTASVVSTPAIVTAPPRDAFLSMNTAERRLAIELQRRLFGPVYFVTGLPSDFLNRKYEGDSHAI
jgi:hypothetical protein